MNCVLHGNWDGFNEISQDELFFINGGCTITICAGMTTEQIVRSIADGLGLGVRTVSAIFSAMTGDVKGIITYGTMAVAKLMDILAPYLPQAQTETSPYVYEGGGSPPAGWSPYHYGC